MVYQELQVETNLTLVIFEQLLIEQTKILNDVFPNVSERFTVHISRNMFSA